MMRDTSADARGPGHGPYRGTSSAPARYPPWRSYALYLTPQGRDTLGQIQAAGNRHQDEIGASLTQAERIQLASLLRRLATEQGITEDNLPGIPPRPPLPSAKPRTVRPARGTGPAG